MDCDYCWDVNNTETACKKCGLQKENNEEMKKMRVVCPKCKEHNIHIEDHTLLGGSKDYWACDDCGEEQVMFGTKQQEYYGETKS